MSSQKTLLLIDSHALIHRAFHAFPDSLTTSSGEVVNAVYGFARLLLEVLEKFEPDYVIAATDMPGKTVRHQKYGQYKANRKPADDLLIQQLPLVQTLLEHFDIPMIGIEGFEADDVIGTLDDSFGKQGHGHHTIIVTGDRDLFQLVDKDTSVYLAGTSFSKSKLFDPKGVEEKMGVGPDYIIDIKALEGDSSDNIPGVAGIGKKGAATLVSEFGHLEEIYESIEDVPNRYKNKLLENYEIAKTSQELATIIKDVPLTCEFSEGEFGTFASGELRQFFQEMQFNSLLRKLDKLIEKHAVVPETGGDQQSLFSGSNVNEAEEIAEWGGQKIMTEKNEMLVYAGITEAGDPLQWELKDLLVVSVEGTILSVSEKKLDNFVELANQAKWVVTENGKALLHVLQNKEFELKTPIYDICLATYVSSMGKTKQDLDSVLSHYNLGYADGSTTKALKLAEVYKVHQEEASQFREVLNLEMSLIPVVVQMERNGIVLDKQVAQGYQKQVEQGIDKLVEEIYTDVGHEFNISSPKQVGEVLFEEKGLPPVKKTKSGNYSTDERSLKTLISVDPVIEKILQYRELTKLLSTYIKPLPKLVNPETGKIHAVFNQMGAITGRFSSKNPNMQNIPLGETAGVNMRDAFTASEGHVLVAMDYSQQELRLLALLSGEENMLRAFKEGMDIHAVTASEIFEVPLEKVDKEMRKAGKTINFGIVYGISAFGLSDRLKIDQKKAGSFIKKYFDRYPKVREYYDSLIARAKEEGYVSTLFGRKRHTADLHSRNYIVRQATEREVMNFPLQGTAADLTKQAMLACAPELAKFGARMVLQVHDELVFEYPFAQPITQLQENKKFREFVEVISSKMLGKKKLEVPLDVGVEIGTKWGSLEEIEMR